MLVECGFMSNSGEAELLQSGAYQTKLAVTVLASALNALGADG